ncbi:MAG: hypothetical protein ACUVX9_10710 [Anaerolineae bacterium]
MASTPQGAAARRGPIAFFTGTVRRVLLLLLLAVLLPILIAEAILSVNLLRDWRTQQLQGNLENARAVAGAQSAFVADLQREELVLGVAIGPPQPLPAAEANQLLAVVADRLDAVSTISFVSAEGVVTASSDPATIGTDLAGTDYVQALTGGADSFVSDLQAPPPDGTASFIVAQASRGARGELLGLVAATVDPLRLATTPAFQRTGEAAVAIIDRQGALVYRQPPPPPEAPDPVTYSQVPMLRQALAGQEATGTFVSPADGVELLAGAAPIQPIGWASLSSVPMAQAMAPAVNSVLVQTSCFCS